MPELPEGTINAFIQNKNLAKYGLLKDNEGGFLAENFVVRYRVIFTSLRFRGGLARASVAARAVATAAAARGGGAAARRRPRAPRARRPRAGGGGAWGPAAWPAAAAARGAAVGEPAARGGGGPAAAERAWLARALRGDGVLVG